MMFDHLDDPNPPLVVDVVRLQVAGRRKVLARRRRAAYAASVVTAVALVAGGVVLATGRARPTSVRVVTPPVTAASSHRRSPTTSATSAATRSSVPVTSVTSPATTVAPPASTTVASPATTTVASQVVTGPEAVACGSFVAPTSGDSPIDVRAIDGPVVASLSGTYRSTSLGGTFVDARLVVTSEGLTLLNRPMPAPTLTGFTPSDSSLTSIVGATSLSTVSPLCLARFANSDGLTVVIGYYSGYAHCCNALRFVPLSTHGPGATSDIFIGNPPVTIREVGGSAVAVTLDNRFAYAFGCFACSGAPVLVYSAQDPNVSGHVDLNTVNVTRDYPSLVTTDAAQWWTVATSAANATDNLGFFAAWAADECNLGQYNLAFATLEQLSGEGKLSTSSATSTYATGAAYISALRTFLAQNGYIN